MIRLVKEKLPAEFCVFKNGPWCLRKSPPSLTLCLPFVQAKLPLTGTVYEDHANTRKG